MMTKHLMKISNCKHHLRAQFHVPIMTYINKKAMFQSLLYIIMIVKDICNTSEINHHLSKL